MVFDESSCARTTSAWKTSYSVHDESGKKRMVHLLLKQEIHSMRDELLIIRKDLLCLGVGSSPFEAIYVELHYLVGVQNGSNQVHLRKARSY